MVHTYNQDLVSVVVAHCISYAPKVCSHCSRCCFCLLLYDRQRMGIDLHNARPVPQIMTFVFPAFTLNPVFSMASFHIRSLLTHSSRESAILTRSSAYKFSQGTPARNSFEKASKVLSRDPWWTQNFTSNSLLKPSPTRTRLCALAYIPWTNRTIHSSTPSFLRAHQITIRGTRSNAFSRSTKAM